MASLARVAQRAASAATVALIALVALPASAMAQTDGTRGRVAGVGISPPGTPQQAIANEFGRIKSAGINTGTIDVWWDVDAETQTKVQRGSITTSDVDLQLAIQRAKQAGFKVLLEPKVWCPRCAGTTWRGYLDPSDRSAFFESYRAMVNHYAGIAQTAGVDMLFVGSEMSSLQNETEEWREVARQARSLYSGRLTYGVNWNVLSRVHFWESVDLISVSAYFPLNNEEHPSIAQMKADWRVSRDPAWKGRRWLDELAALARDTRKQIFFGEAGYLSSTYALHKPYDETAGVSPDHQLQADAYQALLETFEGQPWWAGVVWWEWSLSPGTAGEMVYSPRNKPAEDLLRRWYAEGWRPSTATPTTAAATGGARNGTSAGSRAASTNPTAPRTTGAATRPTVGAASAAGAAPGAPSTTTGQPAAAGAPTLNESGGSDAGGGTTAGLPSDDAALGDTGRSPSRRAPLIALAVAAMLVALMPVVAALRAARRQPAPLPAAPVEVAPHERVGAGR